MNSLKRGYSFWVIILVMFGSLLLPAQTFASKISDGSTLGGISVENLQIEEAEVELQTKIANWQAGETLEARNEHESLEIPRDIFQFDLNTSIEQLEEKMHRHWSNFFMKKKNVQQELFVSLAPNATEILSWPAHIDTEATLNHALVQASNLAEKPVSLVYIEDANLQQEEIATVSLEIPDISEATIEYLVDKLNGQTMEPNVLYSFLGEMTLPTGMSNAELETSFLASAIYQLVLQADIEIIERNKQETVTSYTEAGLDATVNRAENLDLQLYHTNNFTYTILATITEESVELALETSGIDFIHDFSLENEREIEPRTVYRYSNDLKPGEENIIQEGQVGQQVEVYRVKKTVDGEELEKELLTRDFYAPVPEIIERALVVEEEIVEETTEYPTEDGEGGTFETNFDSIMNEIAPQVNQKQAVCEEDPTNPECQNNTFLLPLLFSCMMENAGQSSQVTEEESEETVVADSTPSICDLLIFSMLLGMADFDTPDMESEFQLNEEEFNYDDLDIDIETEIEEEELAEEVIK